MSALDQTRLLHVAPATGTSGVGDYADDFQRAIRPHVKEIVDLRHGGPGQDTVLDLWRFRRRLRAAVKASAGPTVVHVELSGGAFLPFWATLGLPRRVLVTSTVHDPPWTVWFPWRTKLLARNWTVTHAVHFPTMKLTEVLERRLMRGRLLFAMTEAGTRAARAAMPDADVRRAGHVSSPRPDVRHAEERPAAIGLFGYVYRNKALTMITELRDALDPSIDIRVAGRGTESLPPVAGVTVLGEVNGPDEDAFFESIGLLVMPHGERLVYGRTVHPSSSVLRRSIAYQTPVLWANGLGDDLGAGVVECEPEAESIAKAATALLQDAPQLAQLGADVRARRLEESDASVVGAFLDAWGDAAR